MKTFKEWLKLKEGLFYTDSMGPKPGQLSQQKMMKKNMKKKMKKK